MLLTLKSSIDWFLVPGDIAPLTGACDSRELYDAAGVQQPPYGSGRWQLAVNGDRGTCRRIAAPMRMVPRRSTTYRPARQFSASATIRQIAALDMRHRGPSCQTPSTLPAGSLNVATQRSPSGYGGLTSAPPLAATRSRAASMPWT